MSDNSIHLLIKIIFLWIFLLLPGCITTSIQRPFPEPQLSTIIQHDGYLIRREICKGKLLNTLQTCLDLSKKEQAPKIADFLLYCMQDKGYTSFSEDQCNNFPREGYLESRRIISLYERNLYGNAYQQLLKAIHIENKIHLLQSNGHTNIYLALAASFNDRDLFLDILKNITETTSFIKAMRVISDNNFNLLHKYFACYLHAKEMGISLTPPICEKEKTNLIRDYPNYAHLW